MGRSMRLGALVVLVLSLQLSNYCSLAQPPGSSAQGNVGQGEGAGSKNGPTDSSPTPTPSPTTPTTEPSGDPSPGLGSGAPPMGPAGGKGGQLSPQEKRALAEKEALDEERNEVSEFKERYASRRHWRGFCLCSSNMFTHSPDDSFVTSCFEDLTSACFYQGFEVPLENQTDGIFSYELCHLLTTVEEGSISSDFLSLLDYEVKQKCKHPYKTRSDEFLTFFRDFIKPPPPVMELLEQRNFDGAMFSELTASEAQYIGLPLEFYTGMLSTRDYLIVSGRTVPYTEERQGPADISKVEASVQVNDVFDINEKDFTFSAAFTLSFAWTDANMWSECSGEDDELDSGECQWVWRPEVSGVGSGLVSSVLFYLLTRLSHYSLSALLEKCKRDRYQEEDPVLYGCLQVCFLHPSRHGEISNADELQEVSKGLARPPDRVQSPPFSRIQYRYAVSKHQVHELDSFQYKQHSRRRHNFWLEAAKSLRGGVHGSSNSRAHLSFPRGVKCGLECEFYFLPPPPTSRTGQDLLTQISLPLSPSLAAREEHREKD